MKNQITTTATNSIKEALIKEWKERPTRMLQRHEIDQYEVELRSMIRKDESNMANDSLKMYQFFRELQQARINEKSTIVALRKDLDGMMSEFFNDVRKLDGGDIDARCKAVLYDVFEVRYNKVINKKYVDNCIYEIESTYDDVRTRFIEEVTKGYLECLAYLNNANTSLEIKRRNKWFK